jgi:hypothetical protein
MLYHFDGALIKGGKAPSLNTSLSLGAKRFIRKQYPQPGVRGVRSAYGLPSGVGCVRGG